MFHFLKICSLQLQFFLNHIQSLTTIRMHVTYLKINNFVSYFDFLHLQLMHICQVMTITQETSSLLSLFNAVSILRLCIVRNKKDTVK